MEEMTLAEHHHVIEQLAPQGTYEPFRVPILPWRPRCDTHLFDTKMSHSCVEGRTVDSVAVADQPSHVGVGTDSLDDLLCGPPGRGVCRNVDVEDAAAFQREHEEHVQHLERRGRHCEEVDRDAAGEMGPQERSPCRRRRSTWGPGPFRNVL